MAFNGRFVLNLMHLAARNGANLKELLSISEKSENDLNREHCIIEDVVYNRIIERCVAVTGDQYFGMHAGENLNHSAAGLILQIIQTSKTVKQALEYCCEFANLGCSALPMHLMERPAHYKVTLTPNELWKQQSMLAVRHTSEGVIAFTIREFQSLTRMKHSPLAVHLPWKNDNTREYERVFGCPVLFDKDEIAILLKKEHVEDEVITSDYNLLQVLVSHGEEKSAMLKGAKGFATIVKQSILNLVKPEFPTIEQVAAHLNLSLRTLQRRLKEEKVTYKEIIDELRRDFALSYLKQPDLSIGEIAYLLSYADTSAFTRSFKRWTGETPIAYRKGL